MSSVNLEAADAASPHASHPFRQSSADSAGGELLALPRMLVPLVRHPLVARDQARQELVLAWRVLAHLEFTTLLELEHINPVCGALAQGQSRVVLPMEARRAALRIFRDEWSHSLTVEHLSQQLEVRYGLDRQALGRPGFDAATAELLLEHPHVPPELLRLFLVALSETLVIQPLDELPADQTVAQAVRSVLRAHAADEVHHREFFRRYLPLMWRGLTPQERLQVGRLLPELLWVLLAPDQRMDLRILRAVGFGAREAAQILEEIYPPEAVIDSVLQAARPTLELFHQVGVMAEPSVRRSFLQRELWLDP